MMNWEPTRQKLNDPDLKKGLEAVTELRERIEVVHSPEYPNLLSALMPSFTQLLSKRTKPNADASSDENKLRRSILEVFSRFPHNERMKDYAPSLLSCVMEVLTKDYEENAMIASRIVFDLHHKDYRPVMAEQVQPFLDFVLTSLRMLNTTVTNLAKSEPTKSGPVKSVSSFKVLTECPLTVMLLFQLYPKFIKPNIPSIIPLMIEALSLRPPSSQTLPSAKARELVACQVKTLSFLTYLIRGFSEQMSTYKERIAGNIVSLMQSCPTEAVSTRKELLVATRRILATDFRKGFFPHIDALFDERVLIGSNYRQHSATSNNSQSDSLRPMGYSTLADLVHHVRSELSLLQVSRVIYIFSRVIHDPSQPVTIQTTSARLLLNLVDHIFHNKDSNDQIGRDLLVRILDTLVRKFGTLLKFMLPALKESAQRKRLEQAIDELSCERILEAELKEMTSENDDGSVFVAANEEKQNVNDAEIRRKRKYALGGSPEVSDTVQEVKLLIKPMIMGLKTVIWCIKNYNNRGQVGSKKGKQSSSSSSNISEDRQQLTHLERTLVVEYLKLALPCLQIFKWDNDGRKDTTVDANKTDFREVLEHFAASFTVLDSFDIERTIGYQLPFIFDHILKDSDLLTLPQHLIVSNMSVSFHFCEVLLGFLVGRMDELSECDVTMYLIKSGSQTVDTLHSEGNVPDRARKAYTLLRLFKIVFQSVSLFPENEVVLRSYLQTLVANCLRCATQSNVSGNHFYLLLRLFRSIAGGKFELSYKELLPLLPTILNALYRIYVGTNDENVRANLVEIALAIPARLSSLYPHLPLLLRFILPALRCPNGDIVNLGLRTLEFWVDNLNQEYLYPILSQQETEIMVSLCNHLRPAPYPYGLLSLRLLGKLGGKNRRFLRKHMDFAVKRSSLNAPHLGLTCEWPQKSVNFGSMSGGNNCDGEESEKMDEDLSGSYYSHVLPLDSALTAAVDLLRITAVAPQLKAAPKPLRRSPDATQNEIEGGDDVGNASLPSPLDIDEVNRTKMENVDFTKHSISIMESTKRDQVDAAFNVLKSVLAGILPIGDHSDGVKIVTRDHVIRSNSPTSEKYNDDYSSFTSAENCERSPLYNVVKGLLYASAGEFGQDASNLLSGLGVHLLLLVEGRTVRINKAGIQIDEETFETSRQTERLHFVTPASSEPGEQGKDEGKGKGKDDETDTASASKQTSSSSKKIKLHPMPIFGFFRLVGSFRINPFVFNQAIVDMLCEHDPAMSRAALEIIKGLVETTKTKLNTQSEETKSSFSDDSKAGESVLFIGSAFFESLLFLLCRCCFDKAWNVSYGVFSAIRHICAGLGLKWSKQFEPEVLHAALFALKDCPREVTSHLVDKTFVFLVQMLSFFFSCSYSSGETVLDVLTVPVEFEVVRAKGNYTNQAPSPSVGDSSAVPSSCDDIPEVVIQMLVGDLASPKHIVRYAARFCLKHISRAKDISVGALISGFSSMIKRMLFSRGLRHMSLCDQVGIVDALAFVVEEAPSLYGISNHQILVHISDLLRLASAVDGDKSSDTALLADKSTHVPGIDTSFKGSRFSNARAAAMFLREESVVKVPGVDIDIVVPAEHPYGEQLRVSTLILFRSVVRRHTKSFFDAEATTTIGSIRSHIINLLFRSLISHPPLAVTTSFATLECVLRVGSADGPTKDVQALDKAVLQACIRPVLLNLRDYQKLDVALLGGMARLLSLLATWFNATLGEKLLEHLKSWEDPKHIMEQRIWKPGDEPQVAAAIIELFEFLPSTKSTDFVEKLIQATIRLEQVLPMYKNFSSDASPYRTPLVRYLCRYPELTISFFLAEQSLTNESLNELMLDLLRNKDAQILRDYASGSTMKVLGKCFERPISIIRAEKQQAPNLKRNPAELLAIHGINLSGGASLQQESLLRRDMETKERRMTSKLKVEQKAKSTYQAAVSSNNLPQTSIQELKCQHQAALSAYTASQREFATAKNAHMSAKSAKESAASKDSSALFMTIDALEWQYQGMKIVELLVENDADFFKNGSHSDVLMSYRLLWRSKGRHLRMLHEETLPPKFKMESELIAKLLISYSRQHPDDIDILYDLLRIFLTPSGVDFTFVKAFLEGAVTKVLSLHQKHKLLQRFFQVVGSEGNDESKVLSIQLLILPMLREHLDREHLKIGLGGRAPPTKGSLMYKRAHMHDTEKNNESKKEDAKADEKGKDGSSKAHDAKPEKSRSELVDMDFIRKFMTEALLQSGNPVARSDRLHIELLKISTLLIEFLWKEMTEHRKELIKFTWNHLKSEDSASKHWAYVNVCQFIERYETPNKIILQVYVALLRTHQADKELIRCSLDVLIPALPRRLSPEDYMRAINWTKKIMFEEGHSVPLLMHLWDTIIRHPSVFYKYRHLFVPHMVNSLNRSGLQPTSTLENRTLSLALTNLILCWEDHRKVRLASSSIDEEVETEEVASPGKKKQKKDEAKSKGEESSVEDKFTLSQSMVDLVLNFLVRLALLLSESKEEGAHKLTLRSITLFERTVVMWQQYDVLRSTYFDRVFVLCANEAKSASLVKGPNNRNEYGSSKQPKSSSNKTTPKTQSKSSSSVAKSDEYTATPTSCLVTCLDLFIILLEKSLHRRFFEENATKLTDFIIPCFSRALKPDCGILKRKLKRLLVLIFSMKQLPTKLLHCNFLRITKALMENTILYTGKDSGMGGSGNNTSSSTTSSSKKRQEMQDPFEDGRHGGRCAGYFAVEIVEAVCAIVPKFLDNFAGTLLMLVKRIVEHHVQDATTASRSVTSMNSQLISRGIQQNLATPVLGIVEEACDDTSGGISSLSEGLLSDDRGMKEIVEGGTNIRCLISCIRLLGLRSDVPLCFDSDLRQRYFQALSAILDKSDSVPLLMTTVGIVGKWMTDKKSPITMQERVNFLSKFTFQQLTEVPVQPLFNLGAVVILDLFDSDNKRDKLPLKRKRSVGAAASSTENLRTDNTLSAAKEEELSSKQIHDSFFDVLDRLLVANSLTADNDLRSKILHQFTDNVLASPAKVMKKAEKISMSECNIVDVFLSLLRCDWECLGEKMWVLRFVEQVIGSSKLVGGVELVNCARKIDGMRCPLSRLPILGDFHQPDKAKCQTVNIQSIESWVKLCEVIKEKQTDHGTGRMIFLESVRSLARGDMKLCQDLFQHLLSAAWNACENKEARDAITQALEQLFARPFHAQFIFASRFPSKSSLRKQQLSPSHGTNVLQSTLQAILSLRPLPELDVNLLVYLATNYNAWHEVIQMLEHLYANCSDLSKKAEYLKSLRHCYEELGEVDISLSLALKTSKLPETKKALSFEIYGQISNALTSFNGLINRALEFESNSKEKLLPSEDEVMLWESRFVSLHRESNQWSVLADYAKDSDNSKLMMEYAWKARQWKTVQELLSNPSIVAGLEAGNPQHKMNEIYLAIATNKFGDVEKLHLQAVQLCLHKWQLLPGISTGCNAHTSLLQSFHRLVELRESGQIMVEASNHSSKGTLPDLKNLLSAWRNRLPNEYDPISAWSDVFTWRSHIFSGITSSFQWSEPSALATLHDKPWTAIRMARAARKHLMKDVALMSLGKLTETAMDVSDAFVKLREQIVLCRDSNSLQNGTTASVGGGAAAGLNIVQTTNLSFFDDKQKGELFRLKATFFALLKHNNQANQAFCHAVQICPNYGKAWLSWGEYLMGLSNSMHKKVLAAGNDKSTESAALKKKSVQYLNHAMGCYLEAVHNGHDNARAYLPHCLWMARKNDESGGVLSETLERRGKLLPEWVWLPWIPQLLTSLGRSEHQAVKRILGGIVVRYPQALYHFLRAFYLEHLDIDRARTSSFSDKSSSSGASRDKQKKPTAASRSEDLVGALRKHHPSLWVSLESILEELIVRFRPSSEEELLTTIKALLRRAISQQDIRRANRSSDEDSNAAMIASFSRTLNRVSSKFFRPVSSLGGQNDQRNKKGVEFTLRYKEMFEKDFLIDCASSPTEVKKRKEKSAGEDNHGQFNLQVIIDRLKKWKILLQDQVSSTPSILPLQQVSPSLASISNEGPDLLDSVSSRSKSSSSLFAGSSRDFINTVAAAEKSTSAAITAAAAAEAHATSSSSSSQSSFISSAIEIPGRYFTSFDSRPSPEFHAKLVRFDSNIDVVERDGQLIRRIGLHGSDGRIYHFALQFAVPFSTRTDERNAQMHYIMDRVLRKNLVTSSKNLGVRPCAVIPIAQRLRMTEESLADQSLADIYLRDCARHGVDPDAAKILFKSEVDSIMKETLKERNDDKQETSGESAEKAARKVAQLEAFNKMCKEVAPDILVRYMQSKLYGPEELFAFRKVFACQVAAVSLLQYAFTVTDRSPSKFVFNTMDGRVLSPDFQLNYNNRGLLEQSSPPFRLTRNIVGLMSPTLFEGTFIPAMASISAAITAKSAEMNFSLCLLLRDDIVSWYASKSPNRGETETQELKLLLEQRVTRNVDLIQGRLNECAPSTTTKNDESFPVDSKLRKLILAATSPEKLSTMNQSFQSWL